MEGKKGRLEKESERVKEKRERERDAYTVLQFYDSSIMKTNEGQISTVCLR